MKSIFDFLIESRGQRVRDRRNNRPYNPEREMQDYKNKLQRQHTSLKNLRDDYKIVQDANKYYDEIKDFCKRLYDIRDLDLTSVLIWCLNYKNEWNECYAINSSGEEIPDNDITDCDGKEIGNRFSMADSDAVSIDINPEDYIDYARVEWDDYGIALPDGDCCNDDIRFLVKIASNNADSIKILNTILKNYKNNLQFP